MRVKFLAFCLVLTLIGAAWIEQFRYHTAHYEYIEHYTGWVAEESYFVACMNGMATTDVVVRSYGHKIKSLHERAVVVCHVNARKWRQMVMSAKQVNR